MESLFILSSTDATLEYLLWQSNYDLLVVVFYFMVVIRFHVQSILNIRPGSDGHSSMALKNYYRSLIAN